jgi:hypothetical protein
MVPSAEKTAMTILVPPASRAPNVCIDATLFCVKEYKKHNGFLKYCQFESWKIQEKNRHGMPLSDTGEGKKAFHRIDLKIPVDYNNSEKTMNPPFR